ncbi:MAG TPA: hypothetical protein VM076_19720 [Gemmatimonadaceae bacterium]|nr:hypothetical protein [Gemmatimonadaceae bacterium]
MSCRSAVVFAVLFSAACVPAPLAQPEPVSLKTSRSKGDVIQVASRELTAAGFEIAASDTVAGTLSARRTREKRGNYDYITCKFAENSLAETNLESVLTVTVSASGTGAASDVRIGSSVLAKYPNLEGTPLPRSDSQSDCTSTGTIERQLATALTR